MEQLFDGEFRVLIGQDDTLVEAGFKHWTGGEVCTRRGREHDVGVEITRNKRACNIYEPPGELVSCVGH